MTACLTDEQIESLAADALSGPDAHSLRTHVGQCTLCRSRLDECKANLTYLVDVKDILTTERTALQGSETPAVAGTGEPLPGTRDLNLAPDSIPGYRIIEEVYRGGQGVVYKALQLTTNRSVALKILLGGAFASLRRRDRFRREIDLVASLNHPNIVTVYDSGLTPDGQPYLTMEYIEGLPLDQYVRSRLRQQAASARKTLDHMLGLFARICAAVSHAHQHGVIHRDLKPSNIRIDAAGEPHIVDFGVAKAAVAEHPAVPPPITMDGEFLGTVAYAAPEQLTGDSSLTDVRTDVYALGVILYEMLTAHFPYPVVGQMPDVLRHITETPPAAPSSWSRPRQRHPADRGGVPYRIDAELDTIVLKALAKERERRYQTAEHLGQDIERYRAGQPIDAKRDSALYVLRKTLGRHKVAAGLAATTIVLIALFAVVMSVMYENQRYERSRADDERTRAIAAQADLLAAMMKLGDFALARDDTRDALGQYLGALAINQYLGAADPTNSNYQNNLAAISQRLGDLERQGGNIAAAARHYRRARAICEEVTATDPRNLSCLENMLQIYRRLAAVESDQNRSADMNRCLMKAAAIGQYIVSEPETSAKALDEYAQFLLTCELIELRNPREAVFVAERAVAVSDSRNPEILATLATAYRITGDLAQAIEAQEKAVDLLPSGNSMLRRRLEADLLEMRQAAAGDPAVSSAPSQGE